MTRTSGHFSPFSEVRCSSCCSLPARPLPPEEAGHATCEKCGAAIWLRRDVAALFALRAELHANHPQASAELWQTGGLTANLAVSLGGPLALVSKLDDPWLFSHYASEEAYDAGDFGPFGEASGDKAVGLVAELVLNFLSNPNEGTD